jgi:hypothetical protein
MPAFFICQASPPPTEQLHTALVRGEKAEIIMRLAEGMRVAVSAPMAKISAYAPPAEV